jgi:phage/plasmid-like protein (TIGR03299 family)
MKNIIDTHDRGFVTSTGGSSWYSGKQFDHIEKVTLEHAERVLNYTVTKEPVFIPVDSLKFEQKYQKVEDSFCLFRKDIGKVIYPHVGNRYTLVQNSHILDIASDLMRTYDNIEIDSAVTLSNGQFIILILKIDDFHVEGDNSSTGSYLMITNAFGKESITAYVCQIRARCANVIRIAMAQGEANRTLKKFRHTKHVADRLENHMYDLGSLFGHIELHNEKLNEMAQTAVSEEQVDKFLENLFPSEGKEKSGLTLATGRQAKIKDIYFNKTDLQGLDFTNYRLYNAVTDYSSHEMPMRGGGDEGTRLIQSFNGQGDTLNQRALALL